LPGGAAVAEPAAAVQTSLPGGSAAAGRLTSCQDQGMVQQNSCLRRACCQKQRKIEDIRLNPPGFQEQDTA
jgi:hypothetical protein